MRTATGRLLELNEKQMEILIELVDNEGHPLGKLARIIKRDEGNLYKTLKRLEQINIIYQGDVRKSNNPAQPRKLEHPYYLEKDCRIFKSILKNIILENSKDQLVKLLDSNYADIIMKEFGFNFIYNSCKDLFERPEINRIVSRVLLKNPSIIEAFKQLVVPIQTILLHPYCENYSELNNDYFRFNDTSPEIRKGFKDHFNYVSKDNDKRPPIISYCIFYPTGLGYIHKAATIMNILGGFDKIEVNAFYRRELCQEIQKIYKALESHSKITKGLQEFMELDSYLSPLTSYPGNDPYALIFSRPFERIYDDVYILGPNDVKILKNRAYLIYDKFSDLIFELVHYEPAERYNLNLLIKQFIFYWNKSSFSFDIIINYLERINDENMGSGKYHLKISEYGYQIIDLENGDSLLPPRQYATDVWSSVLCPMNSRKIDSVSNKSISNANDYITKDPFIFLRPCDFFKGDNLRSDFIHIDEIKSELKLRIKGHDRRKKA